MADWWDLPFTEARDYLRNLVPTPDDVAQMYEEQAAARAFTVAGVYRMDFLQEMLDSLQSALAGGTSLADFVKEFAESDLRPGHLETVYITNIQSALGRGNWEQGTDSDIADDIWGWEYHTVGDDRVRPEHEELEGMTFQTGDHDEIFPPWDYNCRCTAYWITQTEAKERGLESDKLPDDVRTALADTNFTSPALGETYSPDLGGYDLSLVAEYLREQSEGAG